MVDHCDVMYSAACELFVVVSFSLPYLSVPPSLSMFPSHAPAPAAAAGGDAETSHQSPSANSADAMTRVMSQVIAQMGAGQIVS